MTDTSESTTIITVIDPETGESKQLDTAAIDSRAMLDGIEDWSRLDNPGDIQDIIVKMYDCTNHDEILAEWARRVGPEVAGQVFCVGEDCRDHWGITEDGLDNIARFMDSELCDILHYKLAPCAPAKWLQAWADCVSEREYCEVVHEYWAAPLDWQEMTSEERDEAIEAETEAAREAAMQY